VSLFADFTYQGMRSISGPYFAILGASAAAVGIVSGFGELIGYALRFVSGYIGDKTRQYWTITFIGYAVNLLAVPLLAFANRWELAAMLIIMERIGKAIRAPVRDVLISNAAKQIGPGWGFGLHKAMDQIGGLTGPLVVALVLFVKGGYKTGFLTLAIPAFLALAVLFVARLIYPRPDDFEKAAVNIESKGLTKVFWIYLASIACIAAGYADFPLIAYHFKKAAIIADNWIPVFYSAAMAVGAIAALVFGKLFDKLGMVIVAFVAAISAFFAPCVFLGGFWLSFLGMILWGVGMGAQESVMRAAVAIMVKADRRGSAYGIFNTGYGIFWFLGSALMGILYDKNILALVIFSISIQLAAIPVILLARKELK